MIEKIFGALMYSLLILALSISAFVLGAFYERYRRRKYEIKKKVVDNLDEKTLREILIKKLKMKESM